MIQVKHLRFNNQFLSKIILIQQIDFVFIAGIFKYGDDYLKLYNQQQHNNKNFLLSKFRWSKHLEFFKKLQL